VGVDPRQGPVPSEDLLNHRAGMYDALDAPAMDVEAETGAVAGAAVGAAADVAADVGVDVAAGGTLEQEDRSFGHDGDDRVRCEVARAQRKKASSYLEGTRYVRAQGDMGAVGNRKAELSFHSASVVSDGKESLL
ncbi:hypothetical protein ACHAPK_011847, partial [Fusarium culmorum]